MDFLNNSYLLNKVSPRETFLIQNLLLFVSFKKEGEKMNCNRTTGFLALIALVFAIFQFDYSNTIIIVATALILLHSFMDMGGYCKSCCTKEAEKPKASKKKK